MGKSKRKRGYRGPTKRRTAIQPTKVPKRFSLKKLYVPTVLLIALVAFSLHAYGGDYSRRAGALTFDESIYARLGFQIKNGMGYNTQNIYNEQLKIGRKLPSYVNRPLFKHPPIFPALISGSYYLLLEKANSYPMAELYRAAIKVSNVMGCLLIVLAYFIGRKFFNEHVGLLASLFMALDFNLWVCSQKVWMETTWVFLMWLSLYLFVKGIERKHYFYWAGVVAGFGMLTKYPTVLVFLIFFTYALIYERQVFRQRELYFGLLISFLMMMPWLYVNYRVFGTEFMERILFAGGGYQEKIMTFAKWAGGVILIGGVLALFRRVRERLLSGIHAVQGRLSIVSTAILFVFMAWLVLQGPFRESIIKTVSWNGAPRHGWKMGMFTQDPWYFYIKQHVEYSPFYLLFLAAVVRVPLGTKYEKLLFWAAFWTLCFASLWGNFQGRYALSFVPAAMLLAAAAVIKTSQWLWSRKTLPWQMGFYAFQAFLVYFLVKTIRVDYLHALHANSAYF